MPRKKRANLAMMENLTQIAGEDTPKRQKRDHPVNAKPLAGKENKEVCPVFSYCTYNEFKMIPTRR